MTQFCERHFSLFTLAHRYWAEVIKPGDWAIDATCGNGHDTLFLSERCEGVIGLDIQAKALQNTAERCKGQNIFLFNQSHETFPDLAYKCPIKLVIYNLGYLPGADKGLTTLVSSTLKSVNSSLKLVLPDGMISISCYPGHEEGAKEQEALLEFCKNLDVKQWTVCHHQWINRNKAPSLLLIKKQNDQ